MRKDGEMDTQTYFGHGALELLQTEAQQFPGLQSAGYPGGWWLQVPTEQRHLTCLSIQQKSES